MDQNGAAKNMNKTETSKKVQYFIITIYNYPRKIQTIGISSSFKIIVNCRYEKND